MSDSIQSQQRKIETYTIKAKANRRRRYSVVKLYTLKLETGFKKLCA